jgi:hypothetical protein
VTVSRARAIDLHRWLARLGPSGVEPSVGLGWLDGDALRGVGTLVVILPQGTAVAAAEAIGALSRSVTRVVAVIAAPDEDAGADEDAALDEARTLAASGVAVVPWFDAEGLGIPIRASAGAIA